MQANIQDLHRFREQIDAARTEATRLGNPALHTILTMGLLAVEDRIVEFNEDARTVRQVETLKRLIGAT